MRKYISVLLALVILVCGILIFVPTQTQAQAAWAPNVSYSVGALVTYGGNTYKCLQAHTSLVGWEPPNVPALWQLQTGGGATNPPAATATKTNTPKPGATNTPTFVPTSGSSCSYVTWAAGPIYYKGTIVKYPANGNYYLEVNNGTNGSDGTDPTISTWYWQPTTCSGGGGNPTAVPTSSGGGGFFLTQTQFNSWFPNKLGFYTYNNFVTAMAAYSAFANTGSDTVKKQEVAAFLANVDQESGGLQYIDEISYTPGYYCDTMGGKWSCAPGQDYHGRGPLQISWNYNYKMAGDSFGVDIFDNASLVGTDGVVTWKTALWFWMTQTTAAGTIIPHNAMVNGNGFAETIRTINGGIECNASGLGHTEMLNRVTYYTNFTNALGVPQGSNLTC